MSGLSMWTNPSESSVKNIVTQPERRRQKDIGNEQGSEKKNLHSFEKPPKNTVETYGQQKDHSQWK